MLVYTFARTWACVFVHVLVPVYYAFEHLCLGFLGGQLHCYDYDLGYRPRIPRSIYVKYAALNISEIPLKYHEIINNLCIYIHDIAISSPLQSFCEQLLRAAFKRKLMSILRGSAWYIKFGTYMYILSLYGKGISYIHIYMYILQSILILDVRRLSPGTGGLRPGAPSTILDII